MQAAGPRRTAVAPICYTSARMSDSMRAWRTHEYGPRPTEVLRLDTVPVPEPEAGEVRVRVQAIPLNLNDLERINGGNMMARPDLPYSPGMEVMGVVDACGPGAEAWAGRRVVAKQPLYSLVYNERGLVGPTRAGRRSGLTVVTPFAGTYVQFDGRRQVERSS